MKASEPTAIRSLYMQQFGKPCVQYHPIRNGVRSIRFPYTEVTALERDYFAEQLVEHGIDLVSCNIVLTTRSDEVYTSLVVKYIPKH